MPSRSVFSGGNKYKYMRIIKHLLVGLTGISLLILAISALLPRQVMNARWVMVGADRDTVLDALRDLRSWQEWNGLLQGVSGVTVDQKPRLSDTGSTIVWTDPRGGQNSIRMTENNRQGIVTEMTIGSNRPVQSGFSVGENKADSVQLHWFVIEELKWYPWEKFYGMMSADMKGPLMQQSLEKFRDGMGAR